MLEPHWLPQDASHPLILDAAQAAAVLTWLHPARPFASEQLDARTIALAQRLLALALSFSTPSAAEPSAAGYGSPLPDPEAPAVYDAGPTLRAALRAWQLHRQARGLPPGPPYLTEAARQALRRALASSAWLHGAGRAEPAGPAAVAAAMPVAASDLAWG